MQLKSTVLIVDDSRVMCEFISLFLSKKHDTITQTDAREALKLIQDGLKPDIIISDLNMPEMDGIDFIEGVRQILSFTPILVVSGAKESEKRIEWLASGADDFLLKPFHPAELDVRVGKLLRKKHIQPVQTGTGIGDRLFGKFAKLAAAF